ncbi:MAG: VanW family protein [Syntrophomonas sp.]
MSSGAVSILPWEDNEQFKKDQKENGTPILIAAYRTVLHDPMPGEENNVHLGARLLKGTVVKPGQVFSQNASVGPYSQERGFEKGPVYIGSQLKTTIGGGVCKIASTLYNVAILSNLPVIERHNHGMPVPYVPYGQDATVSYGYKDFKFLNDTPDPILIWAEGIDNTLYLGFYGKSKPPQVEWHHTILNTIKASRIYRNNPQLLPGTEKVILEGMNGAVVNSWVEINNRNGSTSIKRLGKSYYKPMPYVIEKGVSSSAASTKP